MSLPDESDPDHKRPGTKQRQAAMSQSNLVYHPDYIRLRGHILWVVAALAIFAVFCVFLVLRWGDPLLVNQLLGTLTAYGFLFLVMLVMIVTMWNDSVLLLLVVALFTTFMGVIIGECRRHVASLLYSLWPVGQ